MRRLTGRRLADQEHGAVAVMTALLMVVLLGITAIVVDASSSKTVYVATSGAGIFRTIDGGANWTVFNDGLASLDVRVLVLASGALYAGTSGGVFTLDFATPGARNRSQQ